MLETLSTLISSETEGSQRQSILKIDGKHPLFQGHFPDEPILPGVVLLHLFKKEAEAFFNRKLRLFEVRNVKFTTVVTPKNELQLISNFDRIGMENQFMLSGKAFMGNHLAAKVKLHFKTF